jgi:SAM-dependent methyltransferase
VTADSGPPLPPSRLARRVGSPEGDERSRTHYDRVGRYTRERLIELLGDEWSFQGKRVLDFGCGAGRTLRHFEAEAEVASIEGCDIDVDSVDWVRDNLSPPFSVFRCDETPPLPRTDRHYDLIWALSVFTHIGDGWSAWLLELHRVLADDGLLIATVVGPAYATEVTGEPWDEDRIGMNVLRHWQGWDRGGPTVLHSDWWIRAHWGRLFEVEEIQMTGADRGQHRWVLLRKRGDAAPTEAALEQPEPGEPRELEALRHNVRQLRAELEMIVPYSAWRLASPLATLRRAVRGRWR